MVRELEIAGVASAGGWLRWRKKHAVEPGTPCANCETVLEGPYCHNCGQLAEGFERSIFHLLGEGIESFFHVDGRLWQTLPNLALHPGRLTRNYLDGKRAYQIPPLRLFLIVLLILFFVGGLNLGGSSKTNVNLAPASVNAPGASLSVNGKPVLGKVDEDELNEALSAGKLARSTGRAMNPDEAKRAGQVLYEVENLRASSTPLPADQRTALDATAAKLRADGVVPVKPGPKSGFNRWVEDHVKRAIHNPQLFWMTVSEWGHRAAFVMLPIAAFWLSLLFVFQRRFFIFDHLIFSMHSLAFQGLLISAMFLLTPLWDWFGWLVLLAPVHLFVHMRGTYGSSVLGTLARMFVLFWGSLIGFGLLMLGILWIGLAAMDH